MRRKGTHRFVRADRVDLRAAHDEREDGEEKAFEEQEYKHYSGRGRRQCSACYKRTDVNSRENPGEHTLKVIVYAEVELPATPVQCVDGDDSNVHLEEERAI